MKTQVLIIGSGPGGYTAAIKSSQLGYDTVLVEKEHLGGVCLNRGCVPTKVFYKTSQILHAIKKGQDYGVQCNDLNFDFDLLKSKKNQVIEGLVGGITELLAANNVQIINGEAKFISDNEIEVSGQRISSDKIIVSTGSKELIPQISGDAVDEVIVCDQALDLDEVPDKMAIIGGGVIGVELANIFNSFGSEVSILEMCSTLLPFEDEEIGNKIYEINKLNGIEPYLNSKVEEINKADKGFEIIFQVNGNKESIKVDKVLFATGRSANVDGLELENTSIDFDNKGIKTDNNLKTNVDDIYAIGDVVQNNIQLAHVAAYQGEKVMELIAGVEDTLKYDVVPRCIFTIPEIASVGMTEQELKEKGLDYKVGRFPLNSNGAAVLQEESEGFMKVLTDTKYYEVYGVHMIGPSVTELIGEASLAIELDFTVDEIVETIHAHPTISEAFREANMDVLSKAIHKVY